MYTTENKLKKHNKVCKDHGYCYVEMPDKNYKILTYNHGEKSMKAPFIIYADLESLLEKMSTCHYTVIILSYKKVFSSDYNNKKYHKVKDHCHYTGEYRGAAHGISNLRYKTPR